MTYNEIVKALTEFRNTLDDGYSTAIEYGGKRDEWIEKELNLLCDAIDLINRQKAEIERLEKECKITRAYLHDNGLEWDLLSHNAKVSATSYHGEVISETYTFTVEVETENIIGAKEQIAMALEGVGKVAFTNVCTKSNHLVELPFLPGDDLYWINDDTQEIERQPNGIEAVVYYGNGKFKIVDDGVIDDVGGQWTLLSREDAERFLREKMKKE